MTYYALARMAKEQVSQFAQAFRAAGINETADEMEVYAKQEGHHGVTLRAMIEKYKKSMMFLPVRGNA